MPEENTLAVSHNDIESVNLAVDMKPDERKKIAKMVIENYLNDKDGRKDWEDKRNRWYRLWLGIKQPKTKPWPGASNVNLPLLAIATNQFGARSYQAMFSPPEYVKTLPVEENDVQRAKDVSMFMNWQTMHDMDDFEEDHDKLLMNTPISGTNFMKCYYDRLGKKPVSEYVSGMNVILPYRTKKIEKARRITHENWIHYDELRMRNARSKDFYVDFEEVSESASSFEVNVMEDTKDKVETEEFGSKERPKLVLECQGWYASEGAEKMKPVVFTVDRDSETLLRATSRLVKVRRDEKIINYWIDYHFIPNPEGFYSFGFGHFLEVLNEMANTAFNQIFDSGSLSNMPFGFYGRRAGMRKKKIELRPGMMTEVEDASQIFFPSMQRVDQVLFQVLGVIQNYSEMFTSTSDYLLGREAKGTKTPTATGTLAIIEQGLILYSVMIKRLFRSYKKELRLLYTINSLSLPESKQYRVTGSEEKIAFRTIKQEDFDGKMDIIPVGDPSFASRLSRQQEAKEILSMTLSNPLIVANPQVQILNPKAIHEAYKDVLETYDKKNLSALLPDVPEPPVDPEAENAMIIQGDQPTAKPGEDHVAHLASHEEFKKSPFYEGIAPDRKKLLQVHIDQTRALAFLELQSSQNLGGNGQQQAQPGPSPDIGAGAAQPGPSGAGNGQ